MNLLQIFCQPITIKVQQDRFPRFASLLFNQRRRGLINKKGVQKIGTSSLAKRLGTRAGWSLTTHCKYPHVVTKEQLLMEVQEREEQGDDT